MAAGQQRVQVDARDLARAAVDDDEMHAVLVHLQVLAGAADAEPGPGHAAFVDPHDLAAAVIGLSLIHI